MSGQKSSIRVYLSSEQDTIACGQKLAQIAQAGDLILLEGDLGAGKSTLARAMIRQLVGAPDLDVPSPTFLLVLPYEGNGHSVLHADLYRISSPQEVDELGLDDEEAIVLVEWPSRDPELVKRATLTLEFEMDSVAQGRRLDIVVHNNSERAEQIAELLV